MSIQNKKRRRTPKELERLDREVFSFINSYLLKEGRAPSREEVARLLGLSGTMVAQRAVERLKKKKKIRFAHHSKRDIEIVERNRDSQTSFTDLPFLGTVAAGQPIEAIEEFETISVPEYLIRKNAVHFVLKVRGDSMIDAHICDGDWVIVKKQETASNGELVIALIDNQATLKRFEKKQGRVFLHPENSDMAPIEVGAHQHLRILGIYSGIIRKR